MNARIIFLSSDFEETLIAISISAANNAAARLALEKIRDLRDCEVHMTHIPTPADEAGPRRLEINLTTDPNFSSNDLFITWKNIKKDKKQIWRFYFLCRKL